MRPSARRRGSSASAHTGRRSTPASTGSAYRILRRCARHRAARNYRAKRSPMNDATFEHSHGFELGEISGNVRLGKLESMYEELFAEVIDDGIITQDERHRLDTMADRLGLD